MANAILNFHFDYRHTSLIMLILVNRKVQIFWGVIFFFCFVWSKMVLRCFGQVKFELSWGGETDGGGGDVAGGGGGVVDGGGGVEGGGGGQDNFAVTTTNHNFEASMMQVIIRQVLCTEHSK